jgi:hypothetical protein
MKLEGARFAVYSVEGAQVGEMRIQNDREVWPEGVNGWKHTLDCSVPPYHNLPLQENLAFAKRVNKKNILVALEGAKDAH